MYTIDRRDSVVALDVPPPSAGAPLPVVLADDHTVLLAYIIQEVDPEWDGTYATMVDADSADEPIALVRFESKRSHMFGSPNDEAFAGHPLYDRGLRPYSVSEVLSSSWIRQLERMNSIHPNHRAEMFAQLRHFVFSFHDSTFECVAKALNVTTTRGTMRAATTRMSAKLNGGAP